jgi:hypothetical protein
LGGGELYNCVTMKTFLFVTSLLLANALLYAPSFGSFGGIGGGAPGQGICAEPEGADGRGQGGSAGSP